METENAQKKRKHQDLEELFELLKSLPDEDANELLRRIRDGVAPQDIVETVRHGNILVQFASTLGSSTDSVSNEVEGRSGSGSGSRNTIGGSQEPKKESDSQTEQDSKFEYSNVRLPVVPYY
jgi:hypothetical protein